MTKSKILFISLGLWLIPASGQARFNTAKETKVNSHKVFLYQQGQLIGYSMWFKETYRFELLLNARHQLQWVRCRLPAARLLLGRNGAFRLEEVTPKEGWKLKYDAQGRLVAIGSIDFTFNQAGRLAKIGDIALKYDLAGRLVKLGSAVIKYRADRKIGQVGSLKLGFRPEGRLGKIGKVKFTYRMDGKLKSIGESTFIYHSFRRSMIGATGKEKRLKIRFLWTALDIQNVLRTQRALRR